MSTAVATNRHKYRPRDEARLWNPSPQRVERDFNGDTYVLPARDEDLGNGPGVLVVHGKPSRPAPEHKRGQAGYFDQPILASDIVDHLVGTDGISGKLGKWGVREIFGGPEDEAIKAEAIKAHDEYRYWQDCQIEYDHNRAVQVAKDAGLMPPQPSPQVREAQLRRRKYESEAGLVVPFPCPTCNEPFREQTALDAHIQVVHSRNRDAAPAADGSALAVLQAQVEMLTKLLSAKQAEAPAAEPAPKRRGRPRKVVAE